MKKKLLSLGAFALLMAGAVQAETDVPATLNITGNLTGAEAACAVKVTPATLSMKTQIDDLEDQGTPQSVKSGMFFRVNIDGNTECWQKVLANKVAYRFIGTADDEEGDVLANLDTTETAAQNVGVGVYTNAGTPVALNDTLLASAETTNMGLNLVKLHRREPTTGTVKSLLTIQVERL